MNVLRKIDIAILGLSLVVLFSFVGYVNPQVIAPLNNYETINSTVLFSIDKADYLLIDDNEEFTSPERYDVVDGLKLELEPGEYYWKVVGVFGSEVRTLKINSVVSLEISENAEGEFDVENVGNVRLNVDVYDGEDLIDQKNINVGDSEVSDVEGDEIKFEGSMSDE